MFKKIMRFVPGVGIPMLINFILTFLYARFLDPGQYGILNLYLNTIQIVYALSNSIFQTASLRYYSIETAYQSEKDFIVTYLFGNIIATLILTPLCFIASFIVDYNWKIVVLSIGANSLFQLLCNLFRLKNQSLMYNIIRCTSALLSILALVIFNYLLDPLSYVWPVISVYGSYGLIAILALLMIRNDYVGGHILKSLLIESIKYALPLSGVTILGYIVASCDQYFLMYFLGEESVGNYALGYRLVDALIVNLLMMILLVMTPELNKTYDVNGENESKFVLSKMINAALWIILPFSTAIILYSNYIIEYIFPKYTNAAHIMQLVVFASIFHGLSMFTCKGLELVKKPKFIFYGLAIATVLNCLYNAIFIPIYGIDASAHSSLLAYLFYNVWLLIIQRKYYKLIIDKKYMIKTVAAIIATLIVGISMLHFWIIGGITALILQLLICALVYLLVSLKLGLYSTFK